LFFGSGESIHHQFFLGCGEKRTAPFFAINSTGNIHVQVKSFLGFGTWKPSQ